MRQRQHELRIQTQEGVTFALPLASPVTRCLALMIDLVTIIVCGSAAFTVMGVLLSVTGNFGMLADIVNTVFMLAYFAFSIGYFMVSEWIWQGQTVGKRMLRIRVMDVNALKLQPSQVVLRNLLRAIDMLPFFYFVGGVTSLLNRYSQRLGDLAAGTVVVRLLENHPPKFHDTLEGKFNSLRNYPNLEAALRQRCGPEESAIAYHAVLRRDIMDPMARTQLFKALALHFKERVTFPEDATFGLSDEQYVRNCLDSIHRKKKA